MSSATKKRKMADKDVNCRLRHGLNVHCLAQIFQYLDSADLYIVGGMNDFYKRIINDLVIPKHNVEFQKIFNRKITIAQVFKSFGKKIQKIDFTSINEENLVIQLIQSIGKYCSIGQLRNVIIPGGIVLLYRVGGMNKSYKRTINDLVIPSYELDFEHSYDILLSQIFERYGKNIRNFFFEAGDNDEFEQLLQLIIQYCSADQFKSVEMIFWSNVNIPINLPAQFRNVEKLMIRGDSTTTNLSVQLSKSLRCLKLTNVILNPNFEWTTLTNIRELYLDRVRGINLQNFIELIHHRPNIKVFHHDIDTFDASMHYIGEAMSTFCGNQIQEYNTIMPKEREQRRLLPTNGYYNFLSGFKNLKTVRLITDQVCGGDLVDVIKQLAINNTIEELYIAYSEVERGKKSDVNCIFKERPDLDGFDMPHFRHLKKIEIVGFFLVGNICFHNAKVCVPFKLLSVFGPQILSNVENIRVEEIIRDMDFIKFAPNLRRLDLSRLKGMNSNLRANINTNLENIIQKRNNEQTIQWAGGQSSSSRLLDLLEQLIR